MPRLHDTSFAALVGAAVVLSAACAPRSTRWSASRQGPAPCNGLAVLEVQNDLDVSIAITDRSGWGAASAMPPVLLGPGWHTVEINQDRKHWFIARTVGEKPYSSYPVPTTDSRVRMAVRCRSFG